MSGFKELLIMHIPLATFCLTSPMHRKRKLSWKEPNGEAEGDGTVKDGSRTSFWLNMSWPEANLMPLYMPLL